MTWLGWRVGRVCGRPVIVVALAAACGPGASSDDGEGDGTADDGGAATSTAGSASDTSSATADDDGASADDASDDGSAGCPPNAIDAYPGCGPIDEPGVVEIPEAGCYEVCDPSTPDTCSEGACVRAWVDPCHDQSCDACGGERYLCFAGEPLQPGFEGDLVVSDGCGSGSFSVHSANPAGDIALSVSISGVAETAQMTGATAHVVFELPDPDASVRVRMGPQVSSFACNDAPFGTVLRTYEGIAGTVEVTFEPPAAGSEDQGTATVLLADIALHPTSDIGDDVLLPSASFESIDIWCCPG